MPIIRCKHEIHEKETMSDEEDKTSEEEYDFESDNSDTDFEDNVGIGKFRIPL